MIGTSWKWSVTGGHYIIHVAVVDEEQGTVHRSMYLQRVVHIGASSLEQEKKKKIYSIDDIFSLIIVDYSNKYYMKKKY